MKRRFIAVTTDFGGLERYRTRPSLTNPKLGEARLRNVGLQQIPRGTVSPRPARWRGDEGMLRHAHRGCRYWGRRRLLRRQVCTVGGSCRVCGAWSAPAGAAGVGLA